MCRIYLPFQYEGMHKDNKFHGVGTYTTRRGVYEGEFAAGLKHGRGRMSWLSSGALSCEQCVRV